MELSDEDEAGIQLKSVKYVISGAGDTGLTTKLANIIRSEDVDSKLESLLEEFSDLTATFSNDRTILHHLAMTKPLLKGSEYRGGNVAKCVHELAKRGVDLDMQDITGNTALHYAAMLEDQFCSDALIRQGADLCMKNIKGESAIGDILMYLPTSFSALEERLDNGINVKGDYSKDEDENTSFCKTVTLDFKVLISKIYDHPSDGNILSEILMEVEKNQGIYNTERKHLERVFLHPLTWCFLNYKWHQVRVQYWIQLVCGSTMDRRSSFRSRPSDCFPSVRATDGLAASQPVCGLVPSPLV